MITASKSMNESAVRSRLTRRGLGLRTYRDNWYVIDRYTNTIVCGDPSVFSLTLEQAAACADEDD